MDKSKPHRRSPGLKLPHERDESVGAAGRSPRRIVEQARRDLDAGLVDTDMHATPGLDAPRRRRLLKPGPTRPARGER